MLSSISSTATKIWKKFERKAYRDAFVGAHISNTVASQIVKLRENEGWTQTQLADRAGMKQSRISALEDPNYENIEIRTLRRIASAFDIALMVRFVPFSELARWSANLSEGDIIVAKFDEDELSVRDDARPRGMSSLEASYEMLNHVIGPKPIELHAPKPIGPQSQRELLPRPYLATLRIENEEKSAASYQPFIQKSQEVPRLSALQASASAAPYAPT
jgi:transcriptional regulator with XRE-family HTH domain